MTRHGKMMAEINWLHWWNKFYIAGIDLKK